MRRILALTIILGFVFTASFWAAEEKGVITYTEGRAFVVRGVRTIPAKVGTILMAGDVVAVEEGSAVSIDLTNTGLLKISEKTKFEIPQTQATEERTSSISLFFGGIWTEAKKLIQGESFEIKTPTATAGVRGTVFGTNFDESTGAMSAVVESGHVVASDSSGNTVDLFQGMVGVASSGGMEARVDPVAVAKASISAAQVLDSNTPEAKKKAEEQLKAKAQELKEAAAKQEAEAKARSEAAKAKAAADADKKKAEAEASKKKAEAAKAEAEAAKKKAEAARSAGDKAKAEAEAKSKAQAAARAEAESKAKEREAQAANAEKAKVEAKAEADVKAAQETSKAAEAVAETATKAAESVQQKTLSDAPPVAAPAKAEAPKPEAAKQQEAAPEQTTTQESVKKDVTEELRKIEQEVQQQVEQKAKEEEAQKAAEEAQKPPAEVNKAQIDQLLNQMQTRKDRLQTLLNEIQALMNNNTLTVSQKYEQIQSKKQEAQQLQTQIASAFVQEIQNLQTLGAEPSTISNAQAYSPDALASLIETINSLVLTVPVDIVFDTSKVPGLVNGKIRLPVQAKGMMMEIYVDPRDAKNHQKVREIIEQELRVQAYQQEQAEQERIRLEQLRRLQEAEARKQREGSLNPATATKDGSGVFLPIQIR